MLNELFSWIISGEHVAPLSDQLLVKSQLQIEQRIAAETHRKLIADVRVERLKSSLESQQFREKSNRALEQGAYVNFLNFLIEKLTLKDSVSALSLALEFCLSDDSSEQLFYRNIPRIFATMLELNLETALAFYETHKLHLDKIEGITLLIKRTIVRQALAKFSEAMALQTNPLGVLPLLRSHIDSADEFAVVLLWLLQRNVSPKDIFATHLIHDFLSYYLFTLGQSDSPILQLYTILAQFPKGRELIEQAKKVRCEERGFQRYALTGDVVIASESVGEDSTLNVELKSISRRDSSLDITPTKQNFTALYRLYGQSFLQIALVWYQVVEEDNEELEAFFVDVINGKLTIEQLSALINQVANSNSPKTLEILASFINETTLDKLIKNSQGSVLHLLPHKDTLYRKISDLNVAEFLRQYAEANVPDLDAIPQLMAMFNVFRLVNDDIAGLVYEAILERMLQNPLLFDDEILVKRLKKFGERDALLRKKLAQFESQLDYCITQQSQGSEFTVEGYHTIEDVWLSMAQKIVFLKEMSSLSSSCPHDKHALRARIAKEILNHHRDDFDLDHFLEALEITPELQEDVVSEYERVLVELITTIDEEGLRNKIVAKLAAKYGEDAKWIHKKYGEETVFNLAARNGNVGLLLWMEFYNPPSRLMAGVAALNAAKVKQWNVVNYFCTTAEVKPRQHILDEILAIASFEGALDTVKIICEAEHLPPKKAVEQAFLKAVTTNKVPVAGYLSSLPAKIAPCDAVVVKGFKLAFRDRSIAMLKVLGEIENSLLLVVVEQALIAAASTGDFEVVHVLSSLKENSPRPAALKKAFEVGLENAHPLIVGYLAPFVSPTTVNNGLIDAAHKNLLDIVQVLNNASENKPSQKANEIGLEKSLRNRSLPMMKFFCNLKTNAPRVAAIESNLIQSAKVGFLDGFIYLCNESPIKPRSAIIEQALIHAAGARQDRIVHYICKHLNPSQRTMDQALVASAKCGHASTMRLLCTAPTTPGKQARRIAQKKAMSLNDEDLVELLRNPVTKENLSPTSPKVHSPGRSGFFGKSKEVSSPVFVPSRELNATF